MRIHPFVDVSGERAGRQQFDADAGVGSPGVFD
jgi:hypothetical protein